MFLKVLDESRSFFISNIPEVYKSRVQVGHVLSPVLYRAPSVRINLIVCLIELCASFALRDKFGGGAGLITLATTFAGASVKRIIPEFGLLKENSRKRTKMPTEQEAKPAVVTPSLQQWRSPSTFRGAPSNGLKSTISQL
ncbi:hypothetical protein TNCV_2176831 [Trichonephila clavipes]|uniref:Uncharacterized protein n=1 Tax=Trichonephila clavipes TaxID=2585209 RepID=A0A8X6VU12_TRICX|nr:hypothetical protein TNCV_2176831 [Trichonephila clavipes]